jgi:hypothetical protein
MVLINSQIHLARQGIYFVIQDADLAKAELVEYDHLIKTKKVEEDVAIEDIVNVNSRFPRLCYV